jgi:hypothetical protein
MNTAGWTFHKVVERGWYGLERKSLRMNGKLLKYDDLERFSKVWRFTSNRGKHQP